MTRPAALRRPGRLAPALAASAVALALAADLLASDLPLAVAVDGRLYLLPCLRRPAALLDEDQQTLARRATFLLPTPIPYGPLASHPGGASEPLQPPSLRHPVGTDDRGRDVFARLVHGLRTALLVGGAAALLQLALGGALGLASASSPVADLLLGRVIEVGLVFPAYFLLLAFQGALLAHRGALAGSLEVALAIALTRFAEVARLVRAEALRLRAAPHVEAARAIGAGPLAVALRHVLPLAAGPALVAAALGVGQAILLETGLSFLGLGVPPPTPTWGEILAQAHRSGLPIWLVVAPALAVAGTVYLTGRLADALQSRLEPRAGLERKAGDVARGAA